MGGAITPSTSPTWVRDLSSPERRTQRVACEEALSALRANPTATRAQLLERLQEGDARERFAVAYVLSVFEGPSVRLLGALVSALALPDGDIRWQAAELLAELGRAAPDAATALLHLAERADDPVQRRMALYTLRELGPEREDVAALSERALDDPDEEVRRAALVCFGKLLAPSQSSVRRTLAIAARDRDPRMRRLAAAVLPHLLRHHPDVLAEARTVLRTLISSRDAPLARAARGALEELASAGVNR